MAESRGKTSIAQRYEALLGVLESIATQRDLASVTHDLGAKLRRLFGFDFFCIILFDRTGKFGRILMLESARRGTVRDDREFPVDQTPGSITIETQRPFVVHDVNAETRFPLIMDEIRRLGERSYYEFPLTSMGKKLGILSVGHVEPNAYSDDEIELWWRVANQIAIAVDNALAFEELEALRKRLASEINYLEEEIQTEWNFEQIIGKSPALKRVLKQVETVARTDSTVLILGETGTGKELIARAIHSLSPRCDRTLVKLNCAAIPTGLLESELFGHEKGAFTGAVSQRVGRFEIANKGTLFLDEVGEIPLELQPKLLRVLQEQEFERLGSARTQKVDVRLIAATNCDLEGMVTERRFRNDLYYRLNVFPITIPPLRERREDIPALARWFAQKFAGRMSKQIESIPAATMNALVEYSWPGNVRELENVMERAVILSHGPDLAVPLPEIRPRPDFRSGPTISSAVLSLEEAERAHILSVLRETDWVVGGPTGAASRLGMKRTTLQGRMRKLGITRM
ncbi:MAG TPA: sigma 54-interacting transcriptional regulator [Blastocatellia bacterium]|nr:sigma 54-interacting transcriptional regulator [Blastocatellia bacterium]